MPHSSPLGGVARIWSAPLFAFDLQIHALLASMAPLSALILRICSSPFFYYTSSSSFSCFFFATSLPEGYKCIHNPIGSLKTRVSYFIGFSYFLCLLVLRGTPLGGVLELVGMPGLPPSDIYHKNCTQSHKQL